MSPPSAYDLIMSKELDPIACLEQFGVTEKTKFNLKTLAQVLRSFGDFKDTGYRLKIRKDQAAAIQAVSYLLERYPVQQELGRRQRPSGRGNASEGKERKRAKTRISAAASTPQVREDISVKEASTSQELDNPSKPCVDSENPNDSAALALLELSASPRTHGSKKVSTEMRHNLGYPRSGDVEFKEANEDRVDKVVESSMRYSTRAIKLSQDDED